MNMKKALAVALIVKNKAKDLQACLEAMYQWIDDVVILEPGSIDDTEQVAHRQVLGKHRVARGWPVICI